MSRDTAMNAESKCGTSAGWNAHNRAGEKPCDPCRLAQNDYVRQWRRRGGAAVERAKAMSRARQVALWRLKSIYRAEFDLLVADEVERARDEHPEAKQ